MSIDMSGSINNGLNGGYNRYGSTGQRTSSKDKAGGGGNGIQQLLTAQENLLLWAARQVSGANVGVKTKNSIDGYTVDPDAVLSKPYAIHQRESSWSSWGHADVLEESTKKKKVGWSTAMLSTLKE